MDANATYSSSKGAVSLSYVVLSKPPPRALRRPVGYIAASAGDRHVYGGEDEWLDEFFESRADVARATDAEGAYILESAIEFHVSQSRLVVFNAVLP
jgi:hypothetical protein